MRCIICGGKKFKKVSLKVRDSNNYKVIKCQNCGFFQLNPIPLKIEEKSFYDQNLQVKNIREPSDAGVMEKKSLSDTKRRAEMVSKYIQKNSTILDIGSGYGFFIKEMEKRGYNITGIEVSKERREISSKVTKTKVLDIDLFENDTILPNFDYITLFHVLEHISDPIGFLKIIRKHLNKKLIIEVPNADDMLLGASKEYRDFYWQRAHLSYFTGNTLKRVLKRAGFSSIKLFYIQRYGIENFMNWFISKKPQIEKPIFQTTSIYQWLENYYKKYLCGIGKSDTIVLTAK